jgi:predicted DNA-binding mobile mystery protein A
VTTSSARKSARRHLDARLATLGPAARFDVPRLGWVRALREALGMSAAELGSRLGVSAQSVLALESSEVNDTARLATLRRAAEAMDCTLVYAMIPTRSLQAAVEEQAEQVVDGLARSVQHSMALEGQAAPGLDSQRRAMIADLIDRRGLWSDDLRA